VPSLSGIIETCLYVEDTGRASRFYGEVLGLRHIAGDDRLLAYSVAEKTLYCFSSAVPQFTLSSLQAEQFRPMTEAAKPFSVCYFCRANSGMGKTTR
jgi:catechol 2,3-dioxygenase-like lactoylglutathione lyase family enzyme